MYLVFLCLPFHKAVNERVTSLTIGYWSTSSPSTLMISTFADQALWDYSTLQERYCNSKSSRLDMTGMLLFLCGPLSQFVLSALRLKPKSL